MRWIKVIGASGLVLLGVGLGVASGDWLSVANNEHTNFLIKAAKIQHEIMPLCEREKDAYVKKTCGTALKMLAAKYIAAFSEDEFLMAAGLRPEYQKALSDELMSTVVLDKEHADQVKDIKRQAFAIKSAFKPKTDIIP